MKDTLVMLYALQQVDSNLQELHEQKGDLPAVVSSLETDLTLLHNSISDKKTELDNVKISRERSDGDIIDFKEKIEKYREQQFSVRNNREYDALTKEIDYSTEQIDTLEREFLESEGSIEVIVQDIEILNTKVGEVELNLNDRKAELEILSKETEHEELNLNHQKEKILVRLDKDIVDRYDRIRIARKGKGIAPIRKDCCGGCNNRIPPQHVMEIGTNQKLYLCGHCGRIIVSTEVAAEANQLNILS